MCVHYISIYMLHVNFIIRTLIILKLQFGTKIKFYFYQSNTYIVLEPNNVNVQLRKHPSLSQ